MNWRLKSLAFRVIETMPWGQALYRTAQRFVTKRFLPRVTERSLQTYMMPIDVFRTISGATTALEFGAGRALTTPLLASHAGARVVYAYDLQRLATVPQVNAAIGQLARLIPGNWPDINSLDELREKYGIDYRAPGDARATQLPDHSVDLVYSSATLEHIPPAELRAILRECKRVLRSGGRMCFTIDYHDHYASSDRSIGFMNFYQFGENEWRRYNPDMHYQNRLRHSDYVRLFEEEGLALLENRRIYDSWSETDLDRVRLHASFEAYSRDDLITSNGYFVLVDAEEAGASTAVAATA